MNNVSRRRALITGISGQDGAYLAQLLLNKGYEVVGTSRHAETAAFANLAQLGIRDRICLKMLNLLDAVAVRLLLEEGAYDEVYHLAGESSVGQSYVQPREIILGTQTAATNILEGARVLGSKTRYFFAGSGECFGNTQGEPADELTPFRPQSPYAVAKAAVYWQVALYREAYRLRCCTGILFNHESPLRSERFVTGKIVAAARRIAAGSGEALELGDISVQRDWGWAPEYVEAMWAMQQLENAEDYVIATGQTCALRDVVASVFDSLNLDWARYVIYRKELCRPLETSVVRGNPEKAKRKLNWQASVSGTEMARRIAVEQPFLVTQGKS